MQSLAVDLFCGLGGWTIGLQAAGWDVIGFDNERRPYPGQLVLQDVATIDARRWRGKVQLIVASPPCQAYSYRAMPWKRAKALPPPDNSLFEHCFRIAREAGCPIVVENVRGAQPWVGRAKWHYGSFYLWGDVPTLMPHAFERAKVPGLANGTFPAGGLAQGAINAGLETIGHANKRDGYSHTRHLTNQSESAAVKQHALSAEQKKPVWFNDDKRRGTKNGGDWFSSGENCSLMRSLSSRSNARKEASARIAMIPFDLARHIGECFLPDRVAA